MLLACSIENSGIQIGAFNQDDLMFTAHLAASRNRTADEYALLLSNLLNLHQIKPDQFNSAILASVVRPLDARISRAIELLTGICPTRVGPGIKTGLNIRTDIPSQVGADIVTHTVAAAALTNPPLVVIDFGTATTLAGINASGDLEGVLIGPGIQTSLDALSAGAAELPEISLGTPGAIFGKNTHESITSGFIYGAAGMVDGWLERVKNHWGAENLSVIATGHLAETIMPYCTSGQDIRYEPHLALLGLKLIHRLNERRQK